jgi:hypothetical protein
MGPKPRDFLHTTFGEGRHIGVKPRTLHSSREEYQAFDLTQFRNHIYKEQTRQKKEAYYSKQKNG